MEVVSFDRKLSPTCLYSLRDASVKPAEKLGNDILLARTKGLTADQKKDLKEQNVEIIYVREIRRPGAYGVVTREELEGRDDFYGTEVVPYLKLTGAQAHSISNMASELPEPEEPQIRKQQTQKGITALWWPGHPGGC